MCGNDKNRYNIISRECVDFTLHCDLYINNIFFGSSFTTFNHSHNNMNTIDKHQKCEFQNISYFCIIGII